MLTLLGATMYGAKIAMAALPNIEPVSLLILVYTVTFGRKALYPIYIYVGLELMTWGMGLWMLCYLYVWLVLYLFCRLFHNMEASLGWAVLSGAYGLGFGLLCTPVYWASGGWAAGLTWWISGIPFDVLHCAGNFFLALVLFRPLSCTLIRLRQYYLKY